MKDAAKKRKRLTDWAGNMERAKLPRWEQLPDMDLYMDQVITYLEKQTEICKGPYDDKVITTSMVNNYVKNKVIPATVKKKYAPKHLAALISVCVLKQSLPISLLGDIIRSEDVAAGMQSMYNDFVNRQNRALSENMAEFSKKIEAIDPEDRAGLIDYAVELAARGSIQRSMSLRILSGLFEHEDKKKK